MLAKGVPFLPPRSLSFSKGKRRRIYLISMPSLVPVQSLPYCAPLPLQEHRKLMLKPCCYACSSMLMACLIRSLLFAIWPPRGVWLCVIFYFCKNIILNRIIVCFYASHLWLWIATIATCLKLLLSSTTKNTHSTTHSTTKNTFRTTHSTTHKGLLWAMWGSMWG